MMAALRQAWDRVSIYLPLMLMGLLALGSWWLVRSTPTLAPRMPEAAPRHDPDYTMKRFAIRSFDARGQRKHEISGAMAMHYPDTDTLEISQVRVQSYAPNGDVTTATAERGLANADGSEVQLFGNARVLREPAAATGGQVRQSASEMRSDFLHLFTQTEKIRTHRPIVLARGGDRLQADGMEYDNLTQVLTLRGHVRAEILPPTKGR